MLSFCRVAHPSSLSPCEFYEILLVFVLQILDALFMNNERMNQYITGVIHFCLCFLTSEMTSKSCWNYETVQIGIYFFLIEVALKLCLWEDSSRENSVIASVFLNETWFSRQSTGEHPFLEALSSPVQKRPRKVLSSNRCNCLCCQLCYFHVQDAQKSFSLYFRNGWSYSLPLRYCSTGDFQVSSVWTWSSKEGKQSGTGQLKDF